MESYSDDIRSQYSIYIPKAYRRLHPLGRLILILLYIVIPKAHGSIHPLIHTYIKVLSIILMRWKAFSIHIYTKGLQYSPPTQRLSLYVFIPKAYRRLQPLWRIIYIVIRKAHGSSILYQRLIGDFQFILYLWMKITHYLQR